MAGTQTKQSKTDFIPGTWDGGFFHTPHAIRELLGANRINGAIQLQILLEVNGAQARAHGDGGIAEWARGLTLPFLAVKCGRKRNQVSGVEKAIADLAARGLLIKEPDGKPWINGGKLQCKNWKYRIDPNAWKRAPEYEAIAGIDAEEAADEEAEEAEATPAAKIWPADMLMSMPGKGSKPFTIGQAVQRVRIAANTTEMPLAARFRVAENGDLEIRIERAPAKEESQRTVKPATDSKPLNANTSVLEGGSRAKSPAPPAPPPDELAAFLAEHATPITGSAVPSDILARVRENLNGTPLDFLATRIQKRRRALNSNGLLPALAADAREAYHATQAHEPPPGNLDPMPAPPWDDYGSWAGDRHHWHELSADRREFYRPIYPDEVALLNAALDAKGGRA